MKEFEIEDFFSEKKIYGDDLSDQEIETWFKYENEAYAELGSKDREKYFYGYHALNTIHGFNYLPKDIKFKKVLGVGSAYGDEFMPIVKNIESLYILEPSDQLITNKIFDLPTSYVKPNIKGKIDFENETFDLIVCFGTLHHIPNVSYVFTELSRILKPGGYMLIREPIISMGDWRTKRKGLTKYERGIPLSIFRELIDKLKLTIIRESLCFTMTSLIQKYTKVFVKRPLYTKKLYIYLDKILSKMFAWNIHYHAKTKLERIAPSNIFYVLKK